MAPLKMHMTWILAISLAVIADTRTCEDEIVYGVILEKSCDGDPSNNFMRERFLKDRAQYEGGFWGGDLKGAIDPDKAKKACELSMDKYCSVAATLREAHCKLTWEVTVNNVSSYTTK